MPNPFFFAGKITNPEFFVGQEYGSSDNDGEGGVKVREIVKKVCLWKYALFD